MRIAPKFGVSVLAIGILLALALTAGGQGRSSRQRQLKELQSLSLDKLFQEFKRASSRSVHRPDNDAPSREVILTEMIRRGGRDCQKFLAAKLDEWKKRYSKKGDHVKVEDWPHMHNLELLTALRRVQRKKDPLVIEVDSPGAKKFTTRGLSPLRVTLKNVDEGKVPVWFTFGGDYRSGRLARWKCEVRTADGKRLPDRQWGGMMGGGLLIGGGMFTVGPMEHGKSWATPISIESYVRITEPGEYTVQVFYHNHRQIADLEDLTGLVLCKSRPFKIKVEKSPPKVITVTAAETREARRLIKALPETGRIRVVSGYGLLFHGFVKPTSPEGRLHTMGWQAVPALLDTLKEKKLSTHRRGWVLGLLYAITAEEDLSPFSWRHSSELLPTYEYRCPGCEMSGGGKPDAQAQRRLAEKWLRLAADYWVFRQKRD